jgi:hypothetical protein
LKCLRNFGFVLVQRCLDLGHLFRKVARFLPLWAQGKHPKGDREDRDHDHCDYQPG